MRHAGSGPNQRAIRRSLLQSCARMHSACGTIPARSRDFAHPWYAASTCLPRSWTRAIVSTLTPQRSAISGAGGALLRSVDTPPVPACTRKLCQTTASASTWAQVGRAPRSAQLLVGAHRITTSRRSERHARARYVNLCGAEDTPPCALPRSGVSRTRSESAMVLRLPSSSHRFLLLF